MRDYLIARGGILERLDRARDSTFKLKQNIIDIIKRVASEKVTGDTMIDMIRDSMPDMIQEVKKFSVVPVHKINVAPVSIWGSLASLAVSAIAAFVPLFIAQATSQYVPGIGTVVMALLSLPGMVGSMFYLLQSGFIASASLGITPLLLKFFAKRGIIRGPDFGLIPEWSELHAKHNPASKDPSYVDENGNLYINREIMRYIPRWLQKKLLDHEISHIEDISQHRKAREPKAYLRPLVRLIFRTTRQMKEQQRIEDMLPGKDVEMPAWVKEEFIDNAADWRKSLNFARFLFNVRALVTGKSGARRVKAYYPAIGGGYDKVDGGLAKVTAKEMGHKLDIKSVLLATDFKELLAVDNATNDLEHFTKKVEEAIAEIPGARLRASPQSLIYNNGEDSNKQSINYPGFKFSFKYQNDEERQVIVLYEFDLRRDLPDELYYGYTALYSRGLAGVWKDVEPWVVDSLLSCLNVFGVIAVESATSHPLDLGPEFIDARVSQKLGLPSDWISSTQNWEVHVKTYTYADLLRKTRNRRLIIFMVTCLFIIALPIMIYLFSHYSREYKVLPDPLRLEKIEKAKQELILDIEKRNIPNVDVYKQAFARFDPGEIDTALISMGVDPEIISSGHKMKFGIRYPQGIYELSNIAEVKYAGSETDSVLILMPRPVDAEEDSSYYSITRTASDREVLDYYLTSLIHEYIHTIIRGRWSANRGLRAAVYEDLEEGVTELLTHFVLEKLGIDIDPVVYEGVGYVYLEMPKAYLLCETVGREFFINAAVRGDFEALKRAFEEKTGGDFDDFFSNRQMDHSRYGLVETQEKIAGLINYLHDAGIDIAPIFEDGAKKYDYFDRWGYLINEKGYAYGSYSKLGQKIILFDEGVEAFLIEQQLEDSGRMSRIIVRNTDKDAHEMPSVYQSAEFTGGERVSQQDEKVILFYNLLEDPEKEWSRYFDEDGYFINTPENEQAVQELLLKLARDYKLGRLKDVDEERWFEFSPPRRETKQDEVPAPQNLDSVKKLMRLSKAVRTKSSDSL
jgi:hypothetical protein